MSGPVTLTVLDGIDFEIRRGEMLAIVGASGVGKSTFLHIVGGLDHPTSGKVLYGGTDIFSMDGDRIARFRNEHVGFVFQFHHLLPEFSALENVMMPALIRGTGRDAAQQAASRVLSDVGLSPRIHHRPGELSGGEQQRVAVARALMLGPDVVLADEPTGNLDAHTGESIHELLKKINQEQGITFVIVTHNDRLAVRADRVLRMTEGKLLQER
ncbi:MAG: ABC transporter ATP-binding protein [Nitrospirae bacterium GWC2_57_9]|nr:MAG: ABC transporter ATP-binding protein [Nitrospirae bacterium GWC2_57_9]